MKRTFLLLAYFILLSRVAIAAEGSVAGIVTDQDGKPLRGAAITATMGGTSVAKYSDATGKYRLTALKPGNYKVSTTAWGYEADSITKAVEGSETKVEFRLKPHWNPGQISTSEYISAFGNDKQIREIEANCTACHNFSWIMRRKGQSAQEWTDFIPNMSPRKLFITPSFPPEKMKVISEDLEKYFGPSSPVPTQSQVQHAPISDEALQATFRYFTPPTKDIAHSLHVGTDGKPWFTEFDNFANRVASFDPATQEFKEYEMPTPKAMPHNPWVSRDGDVWIAEAQAKKLALLDPRTGELTEYPSPTGATIHTLREDSAGYIWSSGFTHTSRFDPRTKKFNVYDVGGYDIAVDSHNNGWTGDGPTGVIWKIEAATGQISKYAVPGATNIRGIEVDAQDNVWFGDVMGHRLGKLDQKTGAMTFYMPPSANFSCYGIVINKETGKMWLGDYLGAQIIRFDPATEQFTEFPFPSPTQMIRFFAADPSDPDHRVWFTDFTNGRIGVMELGRSINDTTIQGRN